jgi:hypothetical protein
MPFRTRARFLPRSADFIAAAAVVCILALLILWHRSSRMGGDERVLYASGGQLNLISRDGRIVIGLCWPSRYPPWTRWEMRELINDDDRWGFISFVGWGVAAPHGVFIAVLAIVPAWWWIVHRGRVEERRRRWSGLCRECGYDLRAAPTRCPECGTAIGVAGMGRIVRPIEGLTNRFETTNPPVIPSGSGSAPRDLGVERASVPRDPSVA